MCIFPLPSAVDILEKCAQSINCLLSGKQLGPLTLFLTFSCAEYESADIGGSMVFQMIPGVVLVNFVPKTHFQSVRQFSSKFHSLFQCVILEGEVLGKVAHHYWNKEYQACGAPHYHILL